MAILFPKAFPPIVKAAIKLVIISVTVNIFNFNFEAKSIPIVPAAVPDKIPHISPMTSLQKLDTLELFSISFNATRAPLTFLAAIEWNTFLSATVTDIPIISKIIPNTINNKTIKILNGKFMSFKADSENIDMKNPSNSFGKRLKELRLEKGLGQVELANKINVSKSIISLWENGLREPTLSYLKLLARFFETTIDDLTGDDNF